MNKLFIALYDLFRQRRKLLWLLLILTTVGMGFLAARLSFNEDITSFLPNDRQGRRTAAVFKSLRIKDKIVILVSAADSATDAPDRMVEAVDAIAEGLQPAIDEGLLRSVTARFDTGLLDVVTQVVYDHLPIFYTDADFARLDSLTRPEAIEKAVERNRSLLASPAGIALQEILLRDPLGLGTPLLSGFRQLDIAADYELYDDHLFMPGLGTVLLFADPAEGSSATAANDRLVSLIEEQLETVAAAWDVQTDYFGAVGVAVYNARQIKRDTMWTLSLALVIIVAVIFFSFRNRRAILLMIVPVFYGALFALAAIYFIQGSISNIAVGAGAAVLGVALSYSIHVLVHSTHTRDPRRVVEELAYPLTVGSFTTVGAFLGLTFTRSQLLHDFGLFSALTLIGTTLFSLLFLPHMLPRRETERKSPLLRRIERFNAYRFDTNRWLLGLIAVATCVCLFSYNDVRFNSDMKRLGYEPERFLRTEQRLSEYFGKGADHVYLIAASEDVDRAAETYAAADALLDSLAAEGLLREHASVADFVIPTEVQHERLARWERFWTPEKRREVGASVRRAALKAGFREEAFVSFDSLLAQRFTPFDPTSEKVTENPLLGDWINRGDTGPLFISRMALDDEAKRQVYPLLERMPELSILDRAYFASRMADVVSNDFNTILLISSGLVFLALLISYGRIELALLASLPMAVSWVLILGMMALLGIEFNIVNIILSTFIFGLGDDFSIFIMDGLLSEYRDGRRLLAAHKTAIFFSAFTTVAGIGVLIFAGHPALRSISVISIVGMLAVVLVAYTVQPVLFRLLISGQTARGGYPYTLAGILNTIYAFVYFLLGCILLQCYIIVLHLLPLGRSRRKAWFHRAIYGFTRLFLATMFTTRTRRYNPGGETFERPAIIVANHQSFIDILLLLSITPKLVMVTNSWVWRSPVFGRIVRYAGFRHAADDYEALTESLRQEIAEGYSVVVYPEGTRSEDCAIKRFHKGAFLLAEQLGVDILPMLIYGAGYISSKRQPFYIKRGDLASLVLPRITPDDTRFGADVRERAKGVRRYMVARYEELKAFHTDDPRHRSAVRYNYLFKGPVLEWYIRIKLRLEKRYDTLDKLLPRDARIVDLGCGYGQMVFLLALRGDRRRLLGIDYDAEKIALARHSFLADDRIRFECADVATCDLPEADAFVWNDMLHYIAPEAQEQLLARCAARLTEGGYIVVREGDSSDRKRHRMTEETERWSIRILGFNKAGNALHFISTERMIFMADWLGLHLEVREPGIHTSNRQYIFRKEANR